MEIEIHERVAVLESEMTTIKESMILEQQTDQAILEQLAAINKTINKYQSFVGGIIFILGAIWTFIDSIKGWLLNHLR